MQVGQKLMYALGKANNKELTGKERLNFIESIVQTPYNKDINIKRKRK